MLVESCILYSVASLLFIGPLGAVNSIQDFFGLVFIDLQVRGLFYLCAGDQLSNRGDEQVAAQFQIVYRVADRTLPDGSLESPTETDEETPSEPGARAEAERIIVGCEKASLL